MSTQPRVDLLPLELPIMYLTPRRSLCYLYICLDDLSLLGRLRREVLGAGGALRAIYTYYVPDPGRFLASVTLDVGDALGGLTAILQKLMAVPGLQVIGSTAPGFGMAASEGSALQVAGKPMVVMAREVVGGALKSLSRFHHRGVLVCPEPGVRVGGAGVPGQGRRGLSRHLLASSAVSRHRQGW